LYFRLKGGDRIADDGVYSTVLSPIKETGDYAIVFEASSGENSRRLIDFGNIVKFWQPTVNTNQKRYIKQHHST